MKFGLLKYDGEGNLGDEIQSLAIKRFLPKVDMYFNRNTLSEEIVEEQHLLFMNGWFSRTPERCLPAPPKITPAFVGFHISDAHQSKSKFLSGDRLSYLDSNAPIGARDRETARMLENAGIKSFFSACPTLTLEKRKTHPVDGKIMLVDISRDSVPEHIAKHAIVIKQEISLIYSSATKFQMAEELLDFYRTKARLVITSRLHCALPCVAMGIPVIFFGRADDYRLALLEDIGVKINRPIKIKKRGFQAQLKNYYYKYLMRTVDWNPNPVNADKFKDNLEKIIKQNIQFAR